MFSYMLAPQNMKAGDPVSFGPAAPIRTGNTLPLSSIPLGAAIHNVELLPGKGGQMARSAGTSCTLISRGIILTTLIWVSLWQSAETHCSGCLCRLLRF